MTTTRTRQRASSIPILNPTSSRMIRLCRTRLLSVIFGVLFLVSAVCFMAVTKRRAEAADQSTTKLHELLVEKLAILEDDVVLLEKLHKQGEAGFEELYSAHLAKHRAQLDLCQTNQEKITILEKLMKEAKRREESVTALRDLASSLMRHRAQIDRLDIEIQIERLK